MMLQTCTRCRSRRIKCDSFLPACTNCAKSDLECTYRDDALQTDIPRSYIQSLNERIQELSSELALHQHRSDDPSAAAGSASSSSDLYRPLHVMVSGPGSDLHLDLSFPSRMTRVAFGALSLPQDMSSVPDSADNDDVAPNISQGSRALLTPSVLRFLLGRYGRSIKPRYGIAIPQLLNQDGASLKKMPDPQKFKILMACAIAAARESYKSPSWKPIAQICRDWANELITPIISVPDEDALAAILLLLIYELADSSRGATWELLDLAIRTCLQLGLLRTSQVSNYGTAAHEGGNASSPNNILLISTLKDIEGSLQTVFHRPNMLQGSQFPTTSENESMHLLHVELFDQIYGRGRTYETRGCPFVGEVATMMNLIGNFQTLHPVINETWLLFLPICVEHKQCIYCFQEADDPRAEGMISLRRKVVDAASELIASVYQMATANDDFLPPLIGSSRALISGCSIAVSIAKRWTTRTHVKDLIKCTEILTMFAPHWKGGHKYLEVWRSIVNILDMN